MDCDVVLDQAIAVSCASGGSIVESNADNDKDDIILTLAVDGPQVKAKGGQSSEPIVILSDSDDSDNDVTIVTAFQPPASLSYSIGCDKRRGFGEVLGVPIAGLDDEDDDDCFISLSPSPSSSTVAKPTPPVRIGVKRIYEDSSSQSSGDDTISTASPTVDVSVIRKDAFLSDTSSSASNTEDLGFISSACRNISSKNGCPPGSRANKKPSSSIDRMVSRSDSCPVVGTQQHCPIPLAVSTTLTASTACKAVEILTPVTDVCISFDSLLSDNSLPGSVAGSSPALGFASVKDIPDSKSSVLGRNRKVRRNSSRLKRSNTSPASSATSSSISNLLSASSEMDDRTEKNWTIQSKGVGKIVLRRSLSSTSAVTSPVLPQSSESTSDVPASVAIGKQLPLSYSGAKSLDIILQEAASSAECTDTTTQTATCYRCRQQICLNQLSYCMAGHGCCGKCLQSQVKKLLTGGEKGTLQCHCRNFYLVSQLHNSLPSIVVEILEEKLDREYQDNVTKLMLKTIGDTLFAALSDDDFEDRDGAPFSLGNVTGLEVPMTWEPMTGEEEYRLVDLVGGCPEYVLVSALFHETMVRPRAQIVKIQRVQNQTLWQFFMIKKQQMNKHPGLGKDNMEKNLFHGTCRSVVESICRSNFDWRLCGAHGTMYGQGSYFARDASYSHMYTDRPPVSRPSQHRGPTGSLPSQVLTPASPMFFQAFPGSSNAVSLAALHSCRFAHLQGAQTGLQHLVQPPPVIPYQMTSSSSSTSAAAAAYTAAIQHASSAAVPVSLELSAAAAAANVESAQPPHMHCMFLARVLVGNYTTGKTSYRKPPPVDPAKPYDACYDSCVDNVANPSIYVIFNNAQCYPEYIIEYTNKPRDGAA